MIVSVRRPGTRTPASRVDRPHPPVVIAALFFLAVARAVGLEDLPESRRQLDEPDVVPRRACPPSVA